MGAGGSRFNPINFFPPRSDQIGWEFGWNAHNTHTHTHTHIYQEPLSSGDAGRGDELASYSLFITLVYDVRNHHTAAASAGPSKRAEPHPKSREITNERWKNPPYPSTREGTRVCGIFE